MDARNQFGTFILWSLLAPGIESRGNVLYVYASPEVELNDTILLFSVKVQRFVGTDASHNGDVTNVNTVVVKKDCVTPVTSYPGLPDGVDPKDKRISGTPVWMSPTDPRLHYPIIP